MTLGDLIKQFIAKEEDAKRLAIIKTISTEKLIAAWEPWDGMSIIYIDGEYVPESMLVQELRDRGIDPGI